MEYAVQQGYEALPTAFEFVQDIGGGCGSCSIMFKNETKLNIVCNSIIIIAIPLIAIGIIKRNKKSKNKYYRALLFLIIIAVPVIILSGCRNKDKRIS